MPDPRIGRPRTPAPSAASPPCGGFARLACLIHAANVRSEPGSNPSRVSSTGPAAGVVHYRGSLPQTVPGSNPRHRLAGSLPPAGRDADRPDTATRPGPTLHTNNPSQVVKDHAVMLQVEASFASHHRASRIFVRDTNTLAAACGTSMCCSKKPAVPYSRAGRTTIGPGCLSAVFGMGTGVPTRVWPPAGLGVPVSSVGQSRINVRRRRHEARRPCSGGRGRCGQAVGC
jgi:hypothetical protein